jgi:actin-like ATPase involved in cell morphogenesis
MTYGLGVDLGTTFTAAATRHGDRIERFRLGDRSDVAPSVVMIRPDGAVLTGAAAERRATTDPERVAREFKRKLGDPVPMIVGGSPMPVPALLAHLLRAVVAKVSAAEGAPPETVTLTHPASWNAYQKEIFAQVPQLAEVGPVRMVTEPEAAAATYAANERLTVGATVAVYDLGGGTFDATVLRRTESGFQILGTPQGIQGLGGIDFDQAVFAHVRESLGGDATAGADRAALYRLRQECVQAKEALSVDTDVTVPVLLPAAHTHIRLTRGEFEDMVRPVLADTMTALRGALRSADVESEDLTAVLLVGGSSKIPLVAKMVSAEFKAPIAVDTDPEFAVALGAAALSAPGVQTGSAAPSTAAPATTPGTPATTPGTSAAGSATTAAASGAAAARSGTPAPTGTAPAPAGPDTASRGPRPSPRPQLQPSWPRRDRRRRAPRRSARPSRTGTARRRGPPVRPVPSPSRTPGCSRPSRPAGRSPASAPGTSPPSSRPASPAAGCAPPRSPPRSSSSSGRAGTPATGTSARRAPPTHPRRRAPPPPRAPSPSAPRSPRSRSGSRPAASP